MNKVPYISFEPKKGFWVAIVSVEDAPGSWRWEVRVNPQADGAASRIQTSEEVFGAPRLAGAAGVGYVLDQADANPDREPSPSLTRSPEMQREEVAVGGRFLEDAFHLQLGNPEVDVTTFQLARGGWLFRLESYEFGMTKDTHFVATATEPAATRGAAVAAGLRYFDALLEAGHDPAPVGANLVRQTLDKAELGSNVRLIPAAWDREMFASA